MRRDLKQAVGHQRLDIKRSIYSALTIRKELKKEHAKEVLAQEIRANVKLLRRNPKKLAQKIWGGNLSTTPPSVDAEAATTFFSTLFAAPHPPQIDPSELTHSFPTDPSLAPIFTVKEVRKVLRRTRNSSAPGLDGIPYSMLKAFPWLHHLLAHLFSLVALSGTIPDTWRHSITVLLHKKGPTNDLSNFRPISLTPTISKVFHALIATRIEYQLLTTKVLDTSIQKGFLTGISGCVEHDLVLDTILSEAKKTRRTIAISLLDLKNAFGSVPFSRILFAAKHYGLPHWIQGYLSNFYSTLFSVFSCKAWATKPITIQAGVAQGDTLSPVLFLMVMQLLLDGLTKCCPSQGYTPKGEGPQMLKAFADDVTVISKSESGLKTILSHILRLLPPLGLELKPSKCRVFGLAQGKVQKLTVTIMGETLLNISEAPTKFLGMQLSCSQSSKEKAKTVGDAILGVLQIIFFQGKRR